VQPDTPAIPSWSAARPAVIAALTAVPCSDVRIAGPSDAGTVRLAGWRSAASPLPAAAGGWRLDASAVEAVDAPAAETCRLFDAVRVAAADDPDRPFALPAVQRVSLATAPRSDSGYAIVDLQVAERPPGRVLIANIDDDAASDVGRVVSGDVDSAKLELGALPFSAKPARYLAVLVASSTELPVVTARGDQATLRQACTKQDCTLASGWIEIR
jgi:hypothetical protein